MQFICKLVSSTSIALLFSALLSAQTPTATLRGRVADPDRAMIVGASITLTNAKNSTQILRAKSDGQGEFNISASPGNYELKVAAAGFLDYAGSLELTPTTELIEIVLQISPVKTSIVVNENNPYLTPQISSATKTLTPLIDVPQSITIVTKELIRDQMMMSVGDVVKYIPGITAHQGENNRDQVIIRGNSTSADFFVNGVRDDVQYYRDLYNLERVEALKGPNSMIFGRGGAGGVINRVIKEAQFTPMREVSLQGGSFGDKRVSTDLNQPLNDKLSMRFNGMYEDSNTFRNNVGFNRYGVSPSLTYQPGSTTRITLNYEHFYDNRTADRGIPSFNLLPIDVPVRTYFGNPNNSDVHARVNFGTVGLEQQIGRFTLRNRTQFAGYSRGYQNYVPGAVTANKLLYALSGYNNATDRLNIFNQTDLTFVALTGRIRHTFLGGIEVGRQLTDNFRNTLFFNNTATSLNVPVSNPTITTPVTFRQSATDADNHLKTNLAATFVQDQVALSSKLQLVGGLRFDHFDLQYRNNRNLDNLRRIDNLISPRAGLVFKPMAMLSLYGSYSVSYLPSSGDQFSSLTTITQQVKPEKFTNYEVGAKWDFRNLSLTTAVYRLDRTNTRSTDPNNAAAIVQTGSQRTNGFEIGANGNVYRNWKIAGGYAYQDAFVTSATTAARAGVQVGQVPHHVFSIWNNYSVRPRLSFGLGILNRSDMYAAIDNTVILPSYVRVDGAVFYQLTERVRLQVNAENIGNRTYYVNADNNNNISPGSTRAVRAGLVYRF